MVGVNAGTFERDFSQVVSPELAQHLVTQLPAGETVKFPNRYELNVGRGGLAVVGGTSQLFGEIATLRFVDDRQRIELRMERHRIRNAIQMEEDAIVNEELPLVEFERRVSNRESLLLALAEIEAKLGVPLDGCRLEVGTGNHKE